MQNESAEDYINKTVAVGETAEQTEARKRAFFDRMASGTFFLMPGECCRLPPAMEIVTVCHATTIELPGTTPLD